MLSELKNNNINQFFMDCTYRAVPLNLYNFKMMINIGLDLKKKKTVLCTLILLVKENEQTFKIIFKYLSDNYNFKPRRFICDFNPAQINAMKSIFPDCLINTCFFHFSQAIWKNFRKYDLCGKDTYNNNNLELLFNIQLMNFMNRDNIENFYKELKRHYKENKYKKFFNYFSRTWLGNSYPIGHHIKSKNSTNHFII